MIEVFKTNVKSHQQSLKIVSKISNFLPDLTVNFDLEDCDKILRIKGDFIPTLVIKKILVAEGYLCEVLKS